MLYINAKTGAKIECKSHLLGDWKLCKSEKVKKEEPKKAGKKSK